MFSALTVLFRNQLVVGLVFIPVSGVALGVERRCNLHLDVRAGTFAAQVTPKHPSPNDYRRSILEGDAFEILRDLPRIEATSIARLFQFRSQMNLSNGAVKGDGAYIFVPYYDGEWSLPAELPDVRARLSRIVELARAKVPGWKDVQIEVRVGTRPSAASCVFHNDRNTKFLIFDSWRGPRSYVKGPDGVIQLVRSDEAIIVDNEKTIHSYPDSKGGIYEPDRVFVRVTLY